MDIIKSFDEYDNLYNESILNPDIFWDKIASRITWNKKWDTVSNVDFKRASINY